MAGVATAPAQAVLGVREQVALIAELRWQLFRNALRAGKNWQDILGYIVLLPTLALMTLGGAVSMGVATYFLLNRNQPEGIGLLLLAIFLAWQLLPILFGAFAVELDFRTLLVFPLRFPTFFWVSLIYGLLDPAAATSLLWLAGLTTGIALARPELLPWAAVVLLVFAAANLFLNRLIHSWLERLLARRRGRELLITVFILSILALQLFGIVGERWGSRAKPYLQKAAGMTVVLPPGLAGRSVAEAARSNLLGAVADAALLAGYGGLFGWLLRRRLIHKYRGEEVSESRRPEAVAAGARVRPGWVLPGFSGSVAAIYEKEVRYFLRNGPMLITLIIPVLIFLPLVFPTGGSRSGSNPFARAPDLVFPAAVAYMVMVLSHLAYNSLAFEGYGVQFLLAAPVRFRDVMLAKNLFYTTLIGLELLIVWLFIGLFLKPPGLLVLATTLAALALAVLVNLTVGNVLSLQFPRRFDFGKFRQRQSGLTVVVLLGVMLVLVVGGGFVFVLAWRWHKLWLAGVIFLALAGAALVLYLIMLDRTSRLAEARRDVLLGELCRP